MGLYLFVYLFDNIVYFLIVFLICCKTMYYVDLVFVPQCVNRLFIQFCVMQHTYT